MTTGLQQTRNGCLLIADISGYTSYLQETELEHAEDVLADLLETIVASLEPTFQLSKLEGDAAFAHAPGRSLTPARVMDTVEAVYFDFQRRLRDITHSTTCDCNACVLIPNLDLKFVIHQGEYVMRRISRSEELTGPDVILVHRLLKSGVEAVVGSPAYAAYTAATIEAFDIDPSILGFLPHVERFDDIGDVTLFIQDLRTRWVFEQERNREFVTEEEAVLTREVRGLPVKPSEIWQYITDPSKRIQWQEGLTGVDRVTSGRLELGTVSHCVHGPESFLERVIDWRPFAYITTETEVRGTEDTVKLTTLIDELEDGTRVIYRAWAAPDVWSVIEAGFTAGLDSNNARLTDLIANDLAESGALAT